MWWKTYSPPVWMLDGNGDAVNTTDLMGMHPENMIEQVRRAVAPCASFPFDPKPNSNTNGLDKLEGERTTYLVAPHSALFLDHYTVPNSVSAPETSSNSDSDLHFDHVWTYRRHINLDDVDLVGEGLWGTVKRVVGRRGLQVWRVGRVCP